MKINIKFMHNMHNQKQSCMMMMITSALYELYNHIHAYVHKHISLYIYIFFLSPFSFSNLNMHYIILVKYIITIEQKTHKIYSYSITAKKSNIYIVNYNIIQTQALHNNVIIIIIITQTVYFFYYLLVFRDLDCCIHMYL